ncbi:MAG: fimbria major subunit [Candidatus Cryptobacteroides sp.]
MDPDRGGVKIELSENNTRRNPLLVNINLERVSAKIVPETAEDIEYNPLGKSVASNKGQYKIVDMKLEAVAPLNTVKSFNLVQKWEKGAGWTGSSSSGEPRGYPELRCVSPSSSVSYQRETGYWYRMEEYVDYSTLLLKHDIPFMDLKSTPVLYCLENNSPYYDASGLPEVSAAQLESASHPTKMSGRTTGLLFKARVAVARDAHITDPVIPDPDEGEWVSTKSVSASDYKTFYRYDGVLFYDMESILADYPGLAVSSSSSVSELRNAGVEVFEDGYCYYTYYIRDNNYTDNGLHQYSVLRNTRYNLTVKKILSVGDDIPGGLNYNGTDPVDIDRTQLEIIIKASAWTINDVEHEIK